MSESRSRVDTPEFTEFLTEFLLMHTLAALFAALGKYWWKLADMIYGVVTMSGSGAVGRAPFNHRRASKRYIDTTWHFHGNYYHYSIS